MRRDAVYRSGDMGSAAWWQLAVAPAPSVWEREREREGSRVVENGDG
jgi:hypothetical protein